MNFRVFTASHCHQLRSHGWADIVVEFISPQQDILSPEILLGDTEATSSVMTEASASISSEASASITDTAIPEIAMKLPSSTEYWRNWKKEYISKWDFIVWHENGLKKWAQEERRADCVNVNLFSNLKCIYEKLRDALDDEGGKEKYINCKFEEIKMKSVKRSKSCHYVDDLSAVL